MPRRIVLVVNPTAGRGRAGRALPGVRARLEASGDEVAVVPSTDYAHARATMAAAVAGGADVLAVMGGDGMMHLGVNACADQASATPTLLGLVPAGSGNDLCRGVGLDPDDPVAAAGVVADGSRRDLDLMTVAGRHVGAVLATGFDALVNRRANVMAFPRGSSRYTVAALAELRVFSPLRYRLVLDGAPRELEAMLVAVGNTSSYGGGMRICPAADPADGWLDVTVIHPVHRATLLRLLPQMTSGRFARHPCVEQLRARVVRVDGETADGAPLVTFGDGEQLGDVPVDAVVAPEVLPLVVSTAR
ncbi:diacylglycerol/lipid kinase family protein [Microlunatus capsulatus]|uniref:Diacylglycerol kinase (ATP) n=1 Tax=Microlunatus capsulatus TaxID=99117 RepID=A0ABS4ZCL1_9ACTN|nr:diacylglycerol kinase family protein [Microlunatus capsulatus]MBP2418777.1 diacylglycerol kinase (ATP) [Microlunatus capsulatus]